MAKARRTIEQEPPEAGAGERAQDRIAARAYELYLARGGEDGRDWDDWLAAERELSSDTPPGERKE
jgi:hypothetical protein